MKKTLTNLLFSAIAIVTGYVSMVIPFHLLGTLSQGQMRILLAAEILVYFCIFSVYHGRKEAKAQRRAKDDKLKAQHNERVARRNEELKGIIVNNYDLAA